jgi:membrane protein
MLALLKAAFRDFQDDDCPRMAAAMSYFAVFALPPLLALVLMIVGVFVDPADVQGRIQAEMGAVVGADGARQIETMIAATSQPENQGLGKAALGVLLLLIGATGAFGQLQAALNRAWEVKPDPEQGGVRRMLLKRLLSLGMVLTIAFLLLVSLAVSALLSAFGDFLGGLLGGLSGSLLQLIQTALSLGTIAGLFALMFKWVPDARVAWRDVWVGAAFTAALFVLGKSLIALYLSRSDPGSSFGAAGALALILIWVYYSAMILFLGAEFTQVWAVERGSGIEPEPGAIRTNVQGPRQTHREAAD